MAIAQEKMTKVCIFLEHHVLPPSPLNYQVVYTYVSQTNSKLNTAIDRAVAQGQHIDCIYLEQLYFDFMEDGHKMKTTIVNNVDSVINSLTHSAQTNERDITRFANQINDCVHSLDENNLTQTRNALTTLSKQSEQLLIQHKQFKQEIAKAKLLQEKTQKQLSKLRKQHITDQQTGLYKRHYLNQQTQLWLGQNKSLCAIAIQIENLAHFIDNYGDIIGEVILSKVAKQVQKYVFESGLAGRTSKDEFTVLLADIDPETANLIAEKVRNGVEKLRFVSSKNGTKLPSIHVALGIAKHENEGDFNKLSRKASLAASKAKSLGQTSFIAGQ
ncbi:GGDEF domain-containing protein [Pseudoalteromonas mariniglutinosa]|uniref:GGDEF domain-containing protein n=1 Tax=Pseudoalteromonas mariniglutinosa TaxID=206042 RepID=UPI00384B5E52